MDRCDDDDAEYNDTPAGRASSEDANAQTIAEWSALYFA